MEELFGKGKATVFVDRKNEFQILGEIVKKAESGKGSIVLLNGDAGIGKTRLLYEFEISQEGSRPLFLKGRCLPDTDAEPYYPLKESLANYLVKDSDSFQSDRESLPIGLSFHQEKRYGKAETFSPIGLIPMGYTHGSPSNTGKIAQERDKMFYSLTSTIEKLTKTQPLVLFLDDLQWADKSTIQFLLHLSGELSSLPVVVCCAYRTIELEYSENSHVKEGISKIYDGNPNCIDMEINPLTLDDVRDIVVDFLNIETVPQSFINRLYDYTSGNPFFVEGVLQSLMDEGIIKRHSHLWDVNIDLSKLRIPTSITDLIKNRIARLSNSDKNVLYYGAVMGNKFTFEILSKCMGTPYEELLDTLDRLRELHIIQEINSEEEETYVFGHKQTRNVIYNGMGASRKRILHQKIGQVMEETYSDRLSEYVYVLARHFTAGKVFDKAYKYTLQAAKGSMQQFAFEESIEFFKSALRMLKGLNVPDENLEREEILHSIGDLYYALGNWNAAESPYKESLSLLEKKNDTVGISQLTCKLASVERQRGNYDKSESLYDKCISIIEGGGDVNLLDESFRGIGYCHWRRGEYEDAVSYYNKSIEQSKKEGDDHTAAKTLIDLGNVYSNMGELEKGLDYYQSSIPELKKAKDFSEVARAYNNIGEMYLRKKEYDMAIESFSRCKEEAEKVGDKNFITWSTFNLAEAYANKEELDIADKYADRALELCKLLDDKIGMSATYKIKGIIARKKGEYEKSVVEFNNSLIILEMLNIPYNLGKIYQELGTTYSAMDEKDGALENYEMAKDLFETLGSKREVSEVEKLMGPLV